jgi:hypothetical protein
MAHIRKVLSAAFGPRFVISSANAAGKRSDSAAAQEGSGRNGVINGPKLHIVFKGFKGFSQFRIIGKTQPPPSVYPNAMHAIRAQSSSSKCAKAFYEFVAEHLRLLSKNRTFSKSIGFFQPIDGFLF